MPVQSKRICTYPGCNTLVLKGRCDRHPYPQKKKAKRPSSWKQGYDSTWWSVRASYLKRQPYCEYRYYCQGDEATEVDHIQPLRQGGSHDFDNLVACCKRCHSYKTATKDMKREGGKFSGPQTTE